MDKTVVVPVEPTEQMKEAGAKAIQDNGGEGAFDMLVTDAMVAYEAMIAAAPAPAAQDEREALLREYELFADNYANDSLVQAMAKALALTAPQSDEVAIPTHEDQAALMVLLGTRWLQENAPHRLTAPQDAQERNAIIEECAYELLDFYHRSSTRNISDFAAAIRALKTAQPADKPITAQLPDPYDERDGTWFALKDKPEGKAEQQAEPVVEKRIYDIVAKHEVRDGLWNGPKFTHEGILAFSNDLLKTEQHEEQEMTDAEILKIAAENGHGYAGDGKVSPFNGNEDIAEDYISFARALLAAHGVKA